MRMKGGSKRVALFPLNSYSCLKFIYFSSSYPLERDIQTHLKVKEKCTMLSCLTLVEWEDVDNLSHLLE